MICQVSDKFFESKTDTRITWLGNAGFLINSRGTIILIDPLISTKPGLPHISECGLGLKIDLPLTMKQLLRIDLVLYTHTDIDHLGPITAVALAKHRPVFIGTQSVSDCLIELGVGSDLIVKGQVGQTIQSHDIDFTLTPADHPWQEKAVKPNRLPFEFGECCGFILQTRDGTLFFPGDTRLMKEHLLITDVDFLALDVSTDEYHLNSDGAVELANHLSSALIVPMHYGTFDSEKPAHNGSPLTIINKITDYKKRVVTLSPGEVMVI